MSDPEQPDEPEIPLDEQLLDGVVLAGFGAPWCAPWVLLAETREQLRAEGMRVIDVDVDARPDLAERWAVVALPTFLVLASGAERRRQVGAVSPATLKSLARPTRAR